MLLSSLTLLTSRCCLSESALDALLGILPGLNGELRGRCNIGGVWGGEDGGGKVVRDRQKNVVTYYRGGEGTREEFDGGCVVWIERGNTIH